MIEDADTAIIKPRPLYRRYLARRAMEPLLPPTDEEKSDAISALTEQWRYEDTMDAIPRDQMYWEASRVFIEASVPFMGRTPESLAVEQRLAEEEGLLYNVGLILLDRNDHLSTADQDEMWLTIYERRDRLYEPFGRLIDYIEQEMWPRREDVST